MSKKIKQEPTAEQLAAEDWCGGPVSRACRSMTGPDGLLKQLTNTVLETALNQELTEHPGHEENGTPDSQRARATDVNAITQLASARRKRYAEYQPVFWRPTEDADQVHRPYLAQLVQDHDVITLVSEDAGLITGFLIATIGKAPQVYDADGLTCMIDDFIVTPDPWATTGSPPIRCC